LLDETFARYHINYTYALIYVEPGSLVVMSNAPFDNVALNDVTG
jgi:hypothetical protein